MVSKYIADKNHNLGDLYIGMSSFTNDWADSMSKIGQIEFKLNDFYKYMSYSNLPLSELMEKADKAKAFTVETTKY